MSDAELNMSLNTPSYNPQQPSNAVSSAFAVSPVSTMIYVSCSLTSVEIELLVCTWNLCLCEKELCCVWNALSFLKL